jgi:outer membrane protein assembly factor BamB
MSGQARMFLDVQWVVIILSSGTVQPWASNHGLTSATWLSSEGSCLSSVLTPVFRTLDERNIYVLAFGDDVYYPLNNSVLYAVEKNTGQVKWTYGPFGWGPVISGGRVYGASYKSLFALDAETGKELWVRNGNFTFSPNHGFDDGPTVADGEVYAVAGPDFYAFDARTGDQKWKAVLKAHDFGEDYRIVVPNDEVVLLDEGKYLAAYSSGSGKRTWSLSEEINTGEQDPGWLTIRLDGMWYATKNTFFYYDREKGQVSALDVRTGSKKWTVQVHKTGDILYRKLTMQVEGGTFFFWGTENTPLFAIDEQTGEVKWTLDSIQPMGISSGIIYGNMQFGGDRRFVAVNAATSEIEWAAKNQNPAYSVHIANMAFFIMNIEHTADRGDISYLHIIEPNISFESK